MSDQNPMGEGSEVTGVPEGSIGERRAGAETADDARGRPDSGTGTLEWGEQEEATPGPAVQGGQPNLDTDPPLAGRPNRYNTATDDAPGTPPSDARGEAVSS
jgi:hypothetical protein